MSEEKKAKEVARKLKNSPERRCPYCGKKVERLEFRRKTIESGYLDRRGDHHKYPTENYQESIYKCPNCREHLFRDFFKAQAFMKGEVDGHGKAIKG